MSEISSTCHQANNDGDELMIVSKQQHTPLTLACWTGDLALATYLIHEGADPNGKTLGGILPIHFCCMRKAGFPILQYFQENPKIRVDVNAATEGGGKTPLMYASWSGLHKTVEVLLERNAEVNRQDGQGQSALFYAAKGGHLGVVKELVSRNAYVHLRDDDNANILHHLVASSSSRKRSRRGIREVLTYLVEERGLEINAKMENGATPLHKACQFGLTEVGQYLIHRGANLEARIDSWENPLWTHVKSPKPSRDMIMMLFNNGANFQVKNPVGMSLLDYSHRYLENQELTETFKEIQKIIKRRRMEMMRAKRRAILSNEGGSSPAITFTSPPHSPTCQFVYGSPPPEAYLEITIGEEIEVETTPSADMNGKGSVDSGSSSSSSSTDSSSSSDDSDSSTSSSSSSSQLSSISSDDLILNEEEIISKKSDSEKDTLVSNSVQVPAVSTTTEDKKPEGMTTRHRKKLKEETLVEVGTMTSQRYHAHESVLCLSLSSDESGEGESTQTSTTSRTNGLQPRSTSVATCGESSAIENLRRSQRNFLRRQRAADKEGQPERIRRKRKPVLITLSDSDTD